MTQVPIKLGPLTLLLTGISICLTVLAILTFTTARADLRLAEKTADTVRTRYALEAEGQAFLRELDEAAADYAVDFMDDLSRDAQGVYWKTLEQDGSRLRIGFTVRGSDYEIVSWRQEKQWDDDTSLHLWAGF